MRHRWFLLMSLLSVVGTLALGVLLWQAAQLDTLSVVAGRIETIKPGLGAVRWLLIALLAWAWPVLPRPHKLHGDTITHTHWMAWRWRIVGWLLVIELVLGQNLVGRFWGAVSG